MALPDLTGQNIQDTYQRVLQVSSSGDITDGTGSLVIPPTASYAYSASYEIIKEVSSSHADTASYVNPLHQDVQLTGSLNISGSVDIALPSGSVFTIHEPDIDQQNRLDFNFTQGNPILEIASRTTTGSFHLKQDQTGAGLLLDSLGKIKYITGGTTYGIALTSTGLNPNTGDQINLGQHNRRWKNVYINNGDKISFGVNDASNTDLFSLRHTTGTNELVISGSSDVLLNVKGNIITSTITASGNVSSSATSTASFGHYLGDGSELTGVQAFPFTGSAEISGSLTVTHGTASATFFEGNGSQLTNIEATSASFASTASYVSIESLPLVNPIVEYFSCTALTSSGTTITLPNNLKFVSSSVYEYVEVFFNGLRLRYDVDFIPQSTESIQFQIALPSGSELTYKSLKRP
jgi:hypothetical protein